MKHPPYASVIAVILCGSMTAPLWFERMTITVGNSSDSPAFVLATSSPVATPAPALTPQPELELEPSPGPEGELETNTRLACGWGMISRLRNRGDRCVAVPQPCIYPYTCPPPCPAYCETQPCVPMPPPQLAVPTAPSISTPPYPTEPYPTQPIPTQQIPTQPIPTQPIPTQPIPTQPIPPQPTPTQPIPTQPAPTQPFSGSVRGDCNCQDCCQEFRLTRWRVVPVQKEVTEDYVDCVIETSTFCDSSCDQGDCLETIGIQNRKSHVVVQKPRTFTVTELQQETVIEKRCIKCGCIKETRPASSSTYGTQKPDLESTRVSPTTSEPPRVELKPLRPSKQVDRRRPITNQARRPDGIEPANQGTAVQN